VTTTDCVYGLGSFAIVSLRFFLIFATDAGSPVEISEDGSPVANFAIHLDWEVIQIGGLYSFKIRG
jgi:hypothetical protein